MTTLERSEISVQSISPETFKKPRNPQIRGSKRDQILQLQQELESLIAQQRNLVVRICQLSENPIQIRWMVQHRPTLELVWRLQHGKRGFLPKENFAVDDLGGLQ